jgi:excisionase family DNA binding protein
MTKTEHVPSPHEVQDKEILSAEDVAALLGIKRTLSYRLIAPGGPIPSFKVGRLRRCRRSDVDRYVEEQMSPNAK